MRSPESSRIERKDAATVRLYALVFVVVPLACAIGLFWIGLPLAEVGGVVCAAIAVQGIRSNLRFAKALELAGDAVLVHPLWSSAVRTHRGLVQVLIRLARSGDANAPTLVGDYFTLRFPQGPVLVQSSAFPGAAEFVAQVVRAATPGVAFPMRLGETAMQHWLTFPDQPALGVTVEYRSADGTLVTINAYDADTPVKTGTKGAQVRKDLERMLADIGARCAKKGVAVAQSELETRRLGGQDWLTAAVVLGRGPRQAKSRLWMTAQDGRLYKVRVTDPPGNHSATDGAEATLEAFLRANRSRT